MKKYLEIRGNKGQSSAISAKAVSLHAASLGWTLGVPYGP